MDKNNHKIILLAFIMATLALSAASGKVQHPTFLREAEAPELSFMSADTSEINTKWDLWVNGPHLRGANIYQRRV